MASKLFLVIHGRDNVATAFSRIKKGQVLLIPRGNGETAVTANDDIPVGHKFALTPLAPGEAVIKYGQTIGVASSAIRPGDHVHVHNVEGTRGRGDKA